MFSMKIDQKLYTQVILHSLWASEVQIVPSSKCRHFVLKKVRQSYMRWKKNATKPAQINASLIQGREHKEKWTSFYLLPDLCPLCFSCCHVKLQTSVRSPLLTAPTVRVKQKGSNECLTRTHTMQIFGI